MSTPLDLLVSVLAELSLEPEEIESAVREHLQKGARVSSLETKTGSRVIVETTDDSIRLRLQVEDNEMQRELEANG